MSKSITVLKPFTFSTPGVERKFAVGNAEIDEATANHPWIKAGADGHIEDAKEPALRTAAEKKQDAADERASRGR